MKAGDINESDLMKEASEMLNKMKNMPGMGNIQSMLSKMGMNTNGAKVDLKGMEAQLNQAMKTEKMKERLRQKSEMNRLAKEMASSTQPTPLVPQQPAMSDAELDSMFNSMESTETKTKSSNKSKSKSKGKGKGKK
jgi:chromatin remodeling complex protein RSC6